MLCLSVKRLSGVACGMFIRPSAARLSSWDPGCPPATHSHASSAATTPPTRQNRACRSCLRGAGWQGAVESGAGVGRWAWCMHMARLAAPPSGSTSCLQNTADLCPKGQRPPAPPPPTGPPASRQGREEGRAEERGGAAQPPPTNPTPRVQLLVAHPRDSIAHKKCAAAAQHQRRPQQQQQRRAHLVLAAQAAELLGRDEAVVVGVVLRETGAGDRNSVWN